MATKRTVNGADRGRFRPGDLVTIAGTGPTMVIAAWRDADPDIGGDRAGWELVWTSYGALRRAIVPAAALRLAEPAAKD